jgi:hypothetical protein
MPRRSASQWRQQVFTLHQLQHQVGLPAGRDAGIEQARDVRVRQPRQDLPFAPEALGPGVPSSDRCSSLTATAPSKRPSSRRARHTLPPPPWPSGASST